MAQDNTPTGKPSDAHAANAPANADNAHREADLTDEELTAISGGAILGGIGLNSGGFTRSR